MKKYKKIKKETVDYELKEIQCDFCGKKIKGYMNILNSDITSFSISFGYGSCRDLELHNFEICDNCYVKYIMNKAKYHSKEFDERSKT